MIRNLKIFLSVLVLAAVLFGLLYLTGSKFLPGSNSTENNSGPSPSLAVGSIAPFFDLQDTNNGRIKLSQFSNTPLIIFFWSTWDNLSSDQVKIFDDYMASQSRSGHMLVQVLGINSQEDLSIVRSFMRRGGYTVPVVADVLGGTTEKYGIKGLPTIFFIDASGVVRQVWNGALSERQIVDKAERILR